MTPPPIFVYRAGLDPIRVVSLHAGILRHGRWKPGDAVVALGAWNLTAGEARALGAALRVMADAVDAENAR